MQIRAKLTLRFIIIVACIILLSSIAIFFFSANYRKEDFYSRLVNKAYNTAKLLIEVEEIDADLLKKIENNNPVSLPEERIIIIDNEGEIIFSTDEGHFIRLDNKLLERIRLVGEIRWSQENYELLGFLYVDNYQRFSVIIGARDIYGYNKLKNLRTILLIVFGTSTFLVMISGWIFAGKALNPISKVINQVNNISASSLNLRVDKGKENDEISKLANTFNQMLDRLEVAFETQKNFIANASHELRTPLTAIKSEIEVNLMKDRSTDVYKKALHSVLDDMNRLNQISNRLLLLAQTNSANAERDFKPLRIDDLIWDVRTEVLKRNEKYVVNISFDETIKDDNQMIIKGNELLIRTAISNLVDNGCKYSQDHLTEVNIRHEASSIIINFTDHGIGIDKSDLPYIFEPFYRGKNSSYTKGYGIGLSLVERIVTLHNGKIEVVSEPNHGSTFSINFPVKYFN